MADKQLYLPEKYVVTVGKGKKVGLCTVWSEPSIVIKQEPRLAEVCGIIGTLYSKDGLNAIVRNLCLNPDMRYLLIWGGGPLSKTPIGRNGLEVLDKLWDKGVTDEGVVNETGFKLHDTLEFAIIRKMMENVTVIDVSNLTLAQVVEKVEELEKTELQEYMEPVSFPEFERVLTGELPSELVGWTVRGEKVVDAWIKVVDRISRYGIIKKDEYGNDIKEVGACLWVIENEEPEELFVPEWPVELKKTLGVENKAAIEEYINGVFRSSDVPEGSAYSYGNRLRAYPLSENRTTNQIEYMIKKFKECNTSRRVVASLWYPEKDHIKSPPCLNHLQALQTDGTLHMFATFRSHDIFRGGLPNAFALRTVQKEIVDATGFKLGKLAINSISAHIYEQNWEDAENLCKCERWERQAEQIRDGEFDDPRGVVIVSVEGDKLVGEVITKEGATISRVEGKNADTVCRELAKLNLLSQPSHYMDVARQLQKAEIARDLGIKFEQDKPLKIIKDGKELTTAFR